MGIGIGDFHAMHARAHQHDFCHQPTEGELQHWQWKPGQSGNPAGRKKGSKNRATLLAEAMLADKTGAIVEKTIGEALAGDKAALRACFNRVAPTGRGRQIRVDLPEETTPESLDGAMDATQRAFLAGEISAEEALAVAAWVRARRADEHEKLLIEERRLRIEELRLRAEERRMRIEVMRDRYSRIFEDDAEEAVEEEEEEVAEDGAAAEGPEVPAELLARARRVWVEATAPDRAALFGETADRLQNQSRPSSPPPAEPAEGGTR
jgi:hypothetical protein